MGLRDVGVRAGRIAAIGDLSPASAGETIDCSGLHVLPGVVDSQVHFREPGMEHKEDLETGSRAAVLGGVTAVFEMPNTNPLTTSEAALADKLARATGRMHCDFAFWVGGTRENAKDVAELERLPGAAGIKVFMGSSTGDLLVEDDEGVASILRNTRRRAAFHSEDEFRLRERLGERVEGDPRRIRSGATRSRRFAVHAAAGRHRAEDPRADPCPAHLHRGGDCLPAPTHKDVATCEATPHHLTLSSEDYATLGTLIQMNPPVRAPRHRDGVWRGVSQGIVDVLGSDHAPHTLEEKAKALSGLAVRHDRRADAGADHARPRQCRPPDAGALRRPDQPRPEPHLRHGAQGPHRRRLRRRPDRRRPQSPRDHHQRAGRLARRLDAL